MRAPLLVADGWVRIAVVAAVFALFQGSATLLGSDFGEAGLVVGLLVVGALLVCERAVHGVPPGVAWRELGLGAPDPRGLAVAGALAVALILVIPGFLKATGAEATMRPGWTWLLPGLFAQAGIAEETLFRGYLFRRIRRGRTFWRAAWLAAIPFAAVHLLLFATLPVPVALTALALSTVLSVPLAWLFELGGDTIWAPAAIHFVIQGALKVVVVPEAVTLPLALVWMAASAGLPLLVLAVPRRQRLLSLSDQSYSR